MPAGPCSHGARVGHGTSDIGDRVVSRLTVKLGRPHSYVGASRLRGHPRASVRFVGGVSNNASVTQKARHIVCASCVYMCKLIVCKLIVPSLTSLMSITNFLSI